MRELEKRRRIKEILYSRVTLVVLLIAALFSAEALWGMIRKERDVREKRLSVETEVEELKDRITFLDGEIEKFNTSRGIEEEIREKFRVVRGDEQVAIIIDNEGEKTNESSELAPEPRWWSRILGSIGGLFDK